MLNSAPSLYYEFVNGPPPANTWLSLRAMKHDEVEHPPGQGSAPRWGTIARNTAVILLTLLVFLFALDLMISSLQHLGKTAAETIIIATSNPFTGLFIGLLITAIIQSSSATTSMVVALVASGSISLEGAVPIIMGANVGTTITSTIVSLGFITRKKEFVRAVSAGTYHDFFNLLTVFLLFPLEYYYGFLSGLSQQIATTFFNQPIGPVHADFSFLGSGFDPVIGFLIDFIGSGFLLAVVAFALLFGSILFFRRVITDMLGLESQEKLQRFFFRSPLKSFGWGLLFTAAIRSSTVTTSLVVPLVAKKFVKLTAAVPFILGANIGTTITAFIAALFNSNAAISIAIAHFLFNLIGVLVFYPIPILREIPLGLATRLGKITRKYRLAGFLYLLTTFFFVPFSLIYLNSDTSDSRQLTYVRVKPEVNARDTYQIITKRFQNQPTSSWTIYESGSGEPSQIFYVYRRGRNLLINNELYEFNAAGSCRNWEDDEGRVQMCIRQILPRLELNDLTFDSVYVFVKRPYSNPRKDSAAQITYISAINNLILKQTKIGKDGKVVEATELESIEPN